MSNMGTLNPTTLSTSGDDHLVRQGGIDYRQSREVLAAALNSARYTPTYLYQVGDNVKGSNGETYRCRVANGAGTGAGVVDPVSDSGAVWIPVVIPCNGNFIPKNSKIDPTVAPAATLVVGTEPSTQWFVGTEMTGVSYVNGVWNATAGTLYRDIPVKNGMEFYTDDQYVGSTADSSRLPDTQGVSLAYDDDNTPTTLRITIDFADAVDVFSAKVELSNLPSLHNVAQVSGSGGATGGGADEIFYENGQNITTDYEISDGKNAMTAGVVTIDDGVTVTTPNGSTWTVV